MPSLGKPTTRSRRVSYPVASGKSRLTKSNPDEVVNEKGAPRSIDGTQVTVSEGHPWRSRSKGTVQDIGGDFFTTRQYVIGQGNAVGASYNLNLGGGSRVQIDYHGPIFPVSPGGQFPLSIHSSDAVLYAKGTTAIARCKPTKSAADLGVALGELAKDGLPHLIGSQFWRDRTRAAKKAGSEYLNVQFGWRPLVHDVKSFVSAVSKSQKLLQQWERDAGRVVRRRYQFPIERSRTEESGLQGITWLNPTCQNYLYIPATQGTYSIIRETYKRTWFSGAFTYYLPTGYQSRKEIDRLTLFANEILGLELSPELLWNVAPWSWAADWFSNTGDVVSNISDAASVGLVMRWGYIMEHSISKVTYMPETTCLRDKSAKASPLTYVTETKVRKGASPFGFGLNWDGLSPFQLSIAAALGISRKS
jgi:hypothetical protein